jgi:hypothetical protein
MPDYEFYKSVYGGSSLTEAEWPELGKRAAEQLARFKRIYTVMAPGEKAESMAVCAMAETLAFYIAAQNGTGGPVMSASIGSVSVSYGSMGTVDLSPRAQARELYRCACLYLDICRGVG